MQFNKTEPKPDNAMEFIRQHLTGTINAEEYHCMLQDVIKLKEDVIKIDAELKKVVNMVLKLIQIIRNNFEIPSNTILTTSMDDNSDADSRNASMLDDDSLIFEETKKNVDDSNIMAKTILDLNSSKTDVENTSQCKDVLNEAMHTTMSDDSSLIFDEKKGNADELNTTMQSEDLNASNIDMENTSQCEDPVNISMQGFTMEIVEVDVVHTKGPLDQTIATASQEDMQFDEFSSDSLVITSTQETVPIEKLSDTSVDNIQDKIEELPVVIKGEDTEEM